MFKLFLCLITSLMLMGCATFTDEELSLRH